MTGELVGKVSLVTGGGRGLGEAICRNLAQAGSKVIVADIQEDLARSVARSLRDEGNAAVPMRLDVTEPAAVEQAIRSIVDAEGRLDVLINNAAVDRTVSVEELTVEEWDRILRTNLSGPFLTTKYALPHMKARRSGQIINIASTASKRAWANASAYHASKWGLLGFSHSMHVEARPHGVKVTALVCGGMRTPFLLDRFADIDVNTLQDPNDVAKTVRFILTAPEGTVIPELMALPMRETSWP